MPPEYEKEQESFNEGFDGHEPRWKTYDTAAYDRGVESRANMDWAAANMWLGVRFVFRYTLSLWRWWIPLAAMGVSYAVLSNGRTIEDALTGAIIGILLGTAFRITRGIYRTVAKLFTRAGRPTQA
jgi:hypothetical protein